MVPCKIVIGNRKNGWFEHKLQTHGFIWTWFLIVYVNTLNFFDININFNIKTWSNNHLLHIYCLFNFSFNIPYNIVMKNLKVWTLKWSFNELTFLSILHSLNFIQDLQASKLGTLHVGQIPQAIATST
jgi:hypothetical protein